LYEGIRNCKGRNGARRAAAARYSSSIVVVIFRAVSVFLLDCVDTIDDTILSGYIDREERKPKIS
jgi:hypothetical protein